MKIIHSLLLGVLLLLPTVLFAEGDPDGTTPSDLPIQTHWTTLGGMQYLQNGKVLSEIELKSVIDSINDPESSSLLRKSESDETLGFIGLGGSVGLSVLSLFFSNDHIYVFGLNISAPYLPLAIPGAVLGIAGELLEMEAGTAKYTSVQRYNRKTHPSDPLTWDLRPQKNGLGLNVSYVF